MGTLYLHAGDMISTEPTSYVIVSLSERTPSIMWWGIAV